MLQREANYSRGLDDRQNRAGHHPESMMLGRFMPVMYFDYTP